MYSHVSKIMQKLQVTAMGKRQGFPVTFQYYYYLSGRKTCLPNKQQKHLTTEKKNHSPELIMHLDKIFVIAN